MVNMKYKEIYAKDFLNKFSENEKSQISELEVNTPESFEINLNNIISILGLEIKETYNDYSGKIEENVIEINANEPITRQRFTIAHEIGHYLLKHEGILYRTENKETYDSYTKYLQEFMANQIAAELLMPEKLVYLAVDYGMKMLNWEKDMLLSTDNIDELTKLLSKKMNVSFQAMSYRLNNLEVFVDIE